MSRRQGPGRHVGSGRIRVDAARAVAKLRDYQLADAHHWVLEVVRAAVAIGATRIFADSDADDVWVGWQGQAPPGNALARVLDELISPTPSKERAYLRLLATGVNTALGVSPRFVDLYSSDGETCERVRYTPGLLEAPAAPGETSALAHLEPTTARPPPKLSGPGFLLHLKRWPGWDTFKRFVDEREAPELRVLRHRCEDVPVPLEVGRSVLGRHASSTDLLRVELGFGLDGYLALLRPSALPTSSQPPGPAHSWADIAECGVIVARRMPPLMSGRVRGAVPLRLFVDAPRMPTNASRSDVRDGESPVREALERGRELVPRLVELVAKELSDERTHSWSEAEHEALRVAAIQLAAAPILGPLWNVDLGSKSYPEALAPLLSVPLVRSANGELVTLQSLAPIDSFVHRLPGPIPADLADFFGHTLWAPAGSPEASLFAGYEPENTSGALKRARRRLRHRRRFYRAEPTAALVPTDRDQLLSLPLVAPTLRASCIPKSTFSVPGLEGEVCLLDPRFTRFGEVRWHLDGRELSRGQFDSPLPFIAVVTAKGLVPRADYAGIEQTPVVQQVMDAVLGAVVRGAEAIARMADGKATPEAFVPRCNLDLRTPGVPSLLARVGRAGLRQAVDLATRAALADDGDGLGASHLAQSHSPLVTCPIFPSFNNEPDDGASTRTFTSLTRLRSRLARTDEVVVVTRDGATAPYGHLTLELDSNEVSLLKALLGPEARIARYLRGRAPAEHPTGRELARRIVTPDGVSLGVDMEGHAAAIAWGGRTTQQLLHYHRGTLLEQQTQVTTRVGCTVAVDDDATVPTPGWRGVAARGPARKTAYLEDALCQGVVDAMAGDLVANLVIPAPTLTVGGPVARQLLLSLGAVDADAKKILGGDRYQRFRALPLVPLVRRETLSLEQVEERWQEALPYLGRDAIIDVQMGDFAPMHVEPVVAEAIGRLLGRAVEDASDELEAHRRAAERRKNRRSHGHKLELPVPWPTPTPREQVEGALGDGWLTLRPGNGEPGLTIRAYVDRRPFDVVNDPRGLPLGLYIDVPEHLADEKFERLSPSAVAKLKSVAARGARRFLLRLAKEQPQTLGSDPRAHELLRAYAEASSSPKSSKTARRALAELRDASMFPALDGTLRSIEEATQRKTVRIADHSGDFLGPLPDEAPGPLDAPILRVPQGDMGDLLVSTLAALAAPAKPRDSTDAVRQLQALRRVERGLVPRPRIDGAHPDLTFDLLDLVAPRSKAGRMLGPGEVTLEGTASVTRVDVYAQGERVTWEVLRGSPSVHVAVEAPALAQKLSEGSDSSRTKSRHKLESVVEDLADALSRRLLEEPAGLPEWARVVLRGAVVAGRVGEIEMLEEGPFFQTTAGDWVGLGVLREQLDRFGPVWTTSITGSRLEPLDPGRLAFRISEDESIDLLATLPVCDAREDLELDATARRQMARPPVQQLELTPQQSRQALAVVKLAGDGVESARGYVAPLQPAGFALAGVHAHRGMKLLGRMGDGCAWPTVAVIDDAGLTPNRTHEGAEQDERWQDLTQRIRNASDRALRQALNAPTDCLVSRRVTRTTSDRTSAVRGMLWLAGRPSSPGAIQLIDRYGLRDFKLEESRPSTSPISGRLLVHAPVGAIGRSALEALVAAGYRKMVDDLTKRLVGGDEDADQDLLLAHVITALGTGHQTNEASGALAVAGFRGEPRELSEVAALIEDRTRVLIVSDEAKNPEHPGPVVVDDGSLTAHALIAALPGAFRATRPGARTVSQGTLLPPSSDGAPAPAAPATVRRRRVKAHALDPLAEELLRRLAAAGVKLEHVSVAARTSSPMMSYAPRFKALKIAGKHAQLAAAGAALLGSDPRAGAAVAVLTAHALAVVGRRTMVTRATDEGAVWSLLSPG